MRAHRPLVHACWITVIALAMSLHAPAAMSFSSAPGTCSLGPTLPVHGPVQAGNGGFQLTSSSPSYAGGQVLTLTLQGTQSFRGLLLYVFDAGGNRVGTFTVPAGYQALSCPGDPSSTLGHTSSTLKSTPVNLTWTAPASTDPLTVAAAVVVDLSTWYAPAPFVLQPNMTSVAPAESAPAGALLAPQAEPNPFVAGTTIRYALPRTGPASLNVYDLSGRLVRSLVAGTQEAGAHRIEWDGRDAAGEAVGAGVFFVRLATEGTAQVQKLIRVESGEAGR